MTVSLRPGADPGQALAVIKQLGTEVSNVRTSGATPDDLDRRYRQWAHTAARQLNSLIGPDDVERLVLTRRYWELTSRSQPHLELTTVELDDRGEAFNAEAVALDGAIKRWERPGIFVVADTSFYINAAEKLEAIDFRPLLDTRGEPVHLVVPIAVVDELEGLKRSKEKHIRWRAGYSLAVFEDRLPEQGA